MKIYLIGSLRNERIPEIANQLTEATGHTIFADWWAPGPEADDYWKKYEELRGFTYLEALNRPAAQHVFHFDKYHLDDSHAAVLVTPAGRSCHLEAGYMVGRGKPVWVLLSNDEERWDVMYQFCAGVAPSMGHLVELIELYRPPRRDVHELLFGDAEVVPARRG